MKCNHCGKEIPNDSNFCEYCGMSLHVHREKKKLWMIPTVALAFCVVALVFACCHEHSLYEATLDRLAFLQGDTSVVEPDGQRTEDPVVIEGQGKNSKEIIQQRDSLQIVVNNLQEQNSRLRKKNEELEDENGYLTTDARLAKEALIDCMGK